MIGAGAVERDGDALHALLQYNLQESLCARAVPYVREGLGRGEALTDMVSADVEQVLRSALGDDAARVRWQAGDVSYGRLGAMFEGFRRFLAEQRAAGVPMRLLAQNDALGTEERIAAYLRFEAMANEVYRPYGHHWACLYDTRAHSTQTLHHVSQVHPRLLEHDGREIPNDDYLEPSAYVGRSGPPPPPPAAVQLDLPVTGPGELVVFRRLLRRWADLHEMGEPAGDVMIAVGESGHQCPPARDPTGAGAGLDGRPAGPGARPRPRPGTDPGHRRLPPAAPRARPRLRALGRPATR
jgi:hypothetical protein